MTNNPATTEEQEAWGLETRLVHGGSLRSQFAETSEALYLTQSYVYASAEQAEERFKSEAGFIYSRYANPTVAMFEERMRLLEGAQAARATATGMAAVTSSLLCYLKAGDHLVAGRALFGSCRYVVEDLCPRYGIASTLIDGRDLGAWQRALRPNTKAVFFETPANPTLDLVDIAAVSEIAHKAGALVVVDNVFATPRAAEAAEARRRRRRLFRHQACRRPGPLPRRHRAGLAGLREGPPAQLPEAHGAVAQPVQCLGDAQGPGDAAPARACAVRGRSQDRRPSGRAAGRRPACSIAAAPTTRRPRWPSARCRASARS